MGKRNFINATEINNGMVKGGNVMAAMATNIGDFAEMVRASMEVRLGEGHDISIEKVTKNNGRKLTGIIIRKDRSNAAPAMYVDQPYDEYLSGVDFGKIVDGMVISYENSKTLSFDTGSIMDYAAIKDRICLKLVNTAKNKDMLKKTPSVPLLDLSAVFYIILSQDEGNTASVTVTDRMAKAWGVGVKDLYAAAKANSKRMLPAEAAPMSEILAGLLCGTEDAVTDRDEVLYVASNSMRINGAAVMLYEGFLEGFAERIGSDYFIIPSSVHELLFLPAASGMDADYIRNMVHEVNSTVVSPEDVLSDSLYRFNRATGAVELV